MGRRPPLLRTWPHKSRRPQPCRPQSWPTWPSPWNWSTNSCGSRSSTTRRRSEPTTASSRRRCPPLYPSSQTQPMPTFPKKTPFNNSARSCPDFKGSKGRYGMGTLVFRFGWLASGRLCKFWLNWGQFNVLLCLSRFWFLCVPNNQISVFGSSCSLFFSFRYSSTIEELPMDVFLICVGKRNCASLKDLELNLFDFPWATKDVIWIP